MIRFHLIDRYTNKSFIVSQVRGDKHPETESRLRKLREDRKTEGRELVISKSLFNISIFNSDVDNIS